ncbi:hypothetical protein [Actinomadura sp. 9N407]|uniref:hypothetical protein n=1 Tax=Actinomadura sp. 9N407 TaxID=3375154 RepID=UPI0037A9A535
MADERVAPDKPPAQQTATTGMTGTTTEPGGTSHHRASRMPRFATDARKRVARVLATIVSVLTTVVVAVLAVHIVFVAFEANTANELVRTVAGWAGDLAWQFRDVFQPADHKLEVAVNYGLAALVYLIIGRIVVGLIRRLA